MWLTTEEFGELPDVTEADINRILQAEDFGAFAQLFASRTEVLQAGKEVPGPRRDAFLQQHGSDPWVLQYGGKDEEPWQMLQVAGLVTRDQVRQAFLSFLAGDEEWCRQFTWENLPEPSKPWWRFW